ncbi:MAG: hypothetical protein ABIJ82_02650 [Patescibacteria group bacterium]
MFDLSETRDGIGEKIEKAKDRVEDVFVLGDVQTKNLSQIIKEGIEEGWPSELDVLAFGLTVIYNGLPNSIKKGLQGRSFEKIPLDIPEIDDYRVMKRLGSGGTNIVYFYSSHEGNSFSVGLKRKGFNTAEEAWKFAKTQKQEYEYFRNMYKNIPNLIPEENQVVYKDRRSEPSVMFVREYVPEPLKDIFKIPKEELENIIISNSEFRDQLLKFVTISLENSNVILNEELDILGDKNLAVAGERGRERLILLDPHTVLTKKPEIRSRIENRLSQLREILTENSINLAIPMSIYQVEKV